MRAPRRAAATLLLALALTALVGEAAVAATPSPTPSADGRLLTFHGDAVAADGPPVPVTVVIDCRSGTCLLTVTTDVAGPSGALEVLSGLTPLVLSGGTGEYDLAAHGDFCAGEWVGPGHLSVSRASGALLLSQSIGGGEQSCGGSEANYTEGSYTLTAALVSGEFCALDDSCTTAAAAPSPAPAGAVRRAAPSAAAPPAPDQPSTLSTLPTVVQAFTLPNLAWAAGGTVVLALLIAFPSYLLDSASEKGMERFDAWRARKRAARTARPAVNGIGWRGLPIALAGVIAASLISSFIDPAFGFGLAGLRVFLSLFASFLVDAVAGWFLVIWFVRRTSPGTAASFRFAPASLIVVTIAVLFTRLTGFQPGIVFGLVAGVAFGSVLADAAKARAALIGLAYSFTVGVIGWIGYSALSGAAGSHPGPALVFVDELLAATAIGGIAALPIALVPLRGLLGGEIFAWKRWVWGVAYAVGLLTFFVVLMPKPFSWATVGLSVWAWGGLFVAYAAVAVAVWLVLARPWRRESERA